MSNAADVIRPPGATHVVWSYGSPYYYKRVVTKHLNQVSEEWQNLTQWLAWNFQTQQWNQVEAGFCSRRLRALLIGPQF